MSRSVVLFEAYVNGKAGLWVSDGTSAGTYEITVTGASATGVSPDNVTALGSRALFNGQDANGLSGLWVTDGTSAGTYELPVPDSVSTGLAPTYLAALGNEALFSGTARSGNGGLWITDGTGTGTSELSVSGAYIYGVSPQYITTVGNKALFNGVDASGNRTLWVTDGTGAGTSELIVAGAYARGLAPTNITAFNGRALFEGTDSNGTVGLWVTDGTSAGTSELAVGGASPSGVSPSNIAVLGSKALFNGIDANGNNALWVTDGTSAGTSELAVTGAKTTGLGLDPQFIAAVGTKAVFSGLDSNGILNLWVTDGTSAGTSELLVPGSALTYTNTGNTKELSLGPAWMTTLGSKAVFTGTDANGNFQLWITDGTIAGTSALPLGSGITNPSPDHYGVASFAAPSLLNPTKPNIVEQSQKTVIGIISRAAVGDTVTLQQTGGTGTLSLGTEQADGSQQLIYTAPAAIAASTTDTVTYTVTDQTTGSGASNSGVIQLDAGPSVAPRTPGAVGAGQATVIGVVTPGLATDALMLRQTNGIGSLGFGAVQGDGSRQIIYTAPYIVMSDSVDPVSYTVADETNGVVATGSASVTLAYAPPCFASGTRIATPDGDIAVEHLRAGDMVVLANGGCVPVRWIGRRAVDCTRHPRAQDAWPVHVLPDAFGPGLPRRELRLSPDHAVYVVPPRHRKGVLIPIRYLINGATVRQESCDRVTYLHVELDQHAVLLAEGLPCESYLDTGNRSAFANGGTVVQATPEFARAVWRAKGCAPLVCDGKRLVDARRRLLSRAAELGHALTDDPGLCLRADGQVVRPVAVEGGRYRFELRRPARGLRLCSRSGVPAEIDASGTDSRRLGLMVTRLAVQRGDNWHDIALGALAEGNGWHRLERNGAAIWRWTDGDARLPSRVVTGEGATVLEVEVAMAMPSWQLKEGRGTQDRGAVVA